MLSIMAVFKFFIPLFALLLLTSGCQSKSAHSRKLNKQFLDSKTLRISFNSDVSSLDPRIGVDYPSAHVTMMLFEGLMIAGLDGGIKPGIAKSYDLSSDHKTYTFYLRPTYWSNGDPVTAFDFEYAWKRVIDPYQNGLGKQNFYVIKNARQIVKGELPLSEVGIKALDESTLRIELEYPVPYFLELVATSSYLPVNASWDQALPNWSNKQNEDFVCNGPYRLVKHALESEIIVEKNPTYWNASEVRMEKIHISIINDLTTQLNLFEKKQLDWLGNPFSRIAFDASESLKKNNLLEFAETLGLYWLEINTESFPFNNKKLRQAFAYAIDRRKLTSYLLQSNESPATGVLPPGIATQSIPFFKDGDKETALRLFNEALSEMGITRKDLPIITLCHSQMFDISSVMQEIQEQLNSTFSIHIQLEQQDFKTLLAKLQKGNYQIAALGWKSWIRDPIYILQTFRDKSDALNGTKWENPRYQQLLAAAEREIDPEKRQHYFNQAEQILIEEMPVIPLYYTTNSFCKNKRLKNVHMTNLDQVDFRWAYFEEDK